jgi:hypothetical protein
VNWETRNPATQRRICGISKQTNSLNTIMAFDLTIPSSFPTLYETEWKIEFQQMQDNVRQYMDSYRVNGDRRQFKRLKRLGSSQVVERDTRAVDARRRVGDSTNLGETEIINLFTAYHQAEDVEIERTEVERLGDQDSPHEQFRALQKAAISRQMAIAAIDGIFADRKLGKTGGTNDPIPAGNIKTSAGGLDYDIIDEVYTEFGADQVLGQGVEGANTWTIFCRHKDLRVLRNDPTLTNRDFSDIRPIDSGRLYSFRDGYIVPLPDAAFANQLKDADANVLLPMFARPAVAWGETGETFARATQPDTWKGNVLLELEEAFGCTTLDWTGVRGIKVPV